MMRDFPWWTKVIGIFLDENENRQNVNGFVAGIITFCVRIDYSCREEIRFH